MSFTYTIMKSVINENPELVKKAIESIPKSELMQIITDETTKGTSETINLLLDLKIPYDMFTESNGLNILLHVAQKSNNLNLIILLLKNGADVNSRDKKQKTILMKSSFEGRDKTVNEILKFNPDLYLTDVNGKNVFNLTSDKLCLQLLYQHENQHNLTKIKHLEELNKEQQMENVKLYQENSYLNNIIMVKQYEPSHPSSPVQEQWELINKSDNEQKNID